MPAAAVALTLLLAACGDDDGGAIEPAATSTTTAVDETTTTAAQEGTTTSTTAAEPSGQVIEIEVAGGQPVGGSVGEEVPLGEQVTIRVTADAPDEIHVHGYDLTVAVGPGEPGEVTFVADIPGQFEVELHESGALVAELTVG